MVLKDVLITGPGGFIGKNLLAMLVEAGLTRRYRFTLLSSGPVKGWNTIVDRRDAQGLYGFGENDVRAAGVERLHAVIHLGAFTPKTGSEADDIVASTANIVNTRHLIATVPVPEKFLFSSTLDVYGPQSQPLREDLIPCPASLYGASKLYCEQMLRAWSRGGVEKPVDLTIMRIGHIYGPGEEAYRKFIPETIARLKNGNPPLLATTGKERRSFFYIDDCCRAIIAILQADRSIDCLNLASSKTTTIGEVADILTVIARRDGRPMENAAPGDREGRDVVMDVSRLAALDLPDETRLEYGLEREYDGFRHDR